MKKDVHYSCTRGTGGVLCPYFIGHGESEICCEGHIPETRIRIKFRSGKDKTFHTTTYCECQYRRCEHYLSVEHFRWPDDDTST